MNPQHRRAFFRASLSSGMLAMLTTGDAPATADASFELSESTVADLQDGMATGKWTARSLSEKYLARIEALDRRGPSLRSVIELNANALATAEALDKERKEKGARGPLHGIPILIKDNIDTADSMATTAGSLALVGAVPPRDALLVQKLRRSGVVLLGKTNLSEWANFRCSYSTSGWSGRGGLTKNPYALDRNPCGSSSGSAVAVAANLCPLAVGTETDGSIVSPASANGIVGLKPTVGLVSRSGVIPISHTQDTAGPMTRTVRDAALLLSVLAGPDTEDDATAAAKDKGIADYTTCLDAKGLRGARIGVARNYAGFHDAVDRLFKEALAVLKTQGAELIDPADVPNADKLGDQEMTVLLYEFKAGLNAYLARLGSKAPVQTLEQLIAFNEREAPREMPFFGQDQFIKAAAKGPLSDKDYQDALAACRRLSRSDGIDAIMDKHRLNALVAPTMGPACLTDLVVGDHWLGSTSTGAAVAGYPHISVPMGFVTGLPVGLSLFGRAWSEPTLLKLAFAFEQATKHRKQPKFLPSATLGR